jgi:hypothetical protein
MVKNSYSLWMIYACLVFFHCGYDTLLCLSFSYISSKPGNYPVGYSLSEVNRLFCSSRCHIAKASIPWKDGARKGGQLVGQNPSVSPRTELLTSSLLLLPLDQLFWLVETLKIGPDEIGPEIRQEEIGRPKTNVNYTIVFLRQTWLVRIHTLVIPHHNLSL